MRHFIILLIILLFAGCATVDKTPQPEPPTVSKPAPPPPARFDGIAQLAEEAIPDRNAIRERHRYDRSIGMTNIKGLRYFFYEPDDERSVVGFSFRNDGSPKINPAGLKRKGAHREYAFQFADRARENIHLAVYDDVKLSGRFSHDNMFRELHFFPRKQLPSIKVDHGKGLLRVTLPTGEEALFDQDTMELVGGALMESPIDFNRSRHHRRNPQVRYQGKYLVITVAQRGEAPRRAKVWGQTKFAEIHYPAKYSKSCRISPKHFWDQRPKRGDTDPKLTMLHQSDNEVFAMVERHCGWNLAELKRIAPKLAEAE